MKNIFNIFESKHKSESINIDEIMDNYKLSYKNIDFDHLDTDTLNANHKLNSLLNESFTSRLIIYIKNLNWQPILKPIYTIALTSILLLSIIYLRKETDDQHYAEILVDKGEKIKLNVNKNLTLWINSQSYVKIPTNGKTGNEIYLEGEVFIEVKPENKKNYSIICGNAIFQIKNGSFNIKTDQNKIVATISKGSVGFYTTNLPKSTQVTLKDNDKATLFKKLDFIAVETERSNNYLYWKTGILQFENTELAEVAKTLTTLFNIQVQIENKALGKEHFSATFNNPEIDNILDKIQSTINCQITGDGSKLIIH